MNKKGSFQFQLYLTYVAIIILVFVIFGSVYYFNESREFTTRTYEAIKELSLSLTNEMDLEIQKMDNVTLSVAYSNLIKDSLLRIADTEDEQSYTRDQISDIRELSEIMVAAIGPAQSVKTLTIYDLEGNRISTGSLMKYTREDVTEKPWYDNVIQSEGSRYIGLPKKDEELADSFSFFKNKYFISLYRTYYGDFNNVQGVVQAQQDAGVVFSSLLALEKEKESNRRYYVLNHEGVQLYPYDSDDRNGGYYYDEFTNSEGKPLYLDSPVQQGKELVSYHVSQETGWMLVAVTSRAKLINSIFQYTMRMIITAFVILVLTLIFTFFGARRITNPIKRLHSSVQKMEINGGYKPDQYVDSGINEIDELQSAFHDMHAKLQHSVDKLLFSQSQEIRATMVALSSQMNPHFLFNTITTISIMAEEGMSEEITRLCQKLSTMLRYISSDQSNGVSMSAEIEYTKNYLECMKIRYPDDLRYTINIEDELFDIPVPKLLIQPLVENCMKHGIHGMSPWCISITGKVYRNQWSVTVSDNGPGMSSAEKSKLYKKIKELEKSGKYSSLSVEGMGLLNIYFRLKLTYQDKMIFHIHDNARGFVITVGGNRIP
ncbi:sensor histidine kinase [Radiobacillus sp. PE A8.2]|uniref:sensor histidine kinase n=1 Tax=Radiobacillus sp. PE A8.2 TaxID=3380349 RepID=UPI0038907C16